MGINKIKADQFEIQKAIKFLADSILDEEGKQIPLKTDKPLLIHCLRVGIILSDFGYNKEIVIAGILHDINEDVGISFNEIEQRFGEEVKKLVYVLTYDQSIPEGEERVKNAYERKKTEDKQAIIISIADHLVNLPYLKFVKDKYTYNKLLQKHIDFLNDLAKVAADESIYSAYQRELKNYSPKLSIRQY